MWGWAVVIVGIAVTGISAVQYCTRAKIHTPLSRRQPATRHCDVPLGMEALDLTEFRRATRRNESLERGQTNWFRRASGSFAAAAETDVEPMRDDATYAARFHAAFLTSKSKGKTHD